MDKLEGWELITRNTNSETELYKVFDPQLQQMMCVKRIYFHSLEDATKGSSEVNNQMRIKSPNVCQVHAFQAGLIKGQLALEIEMELLDCDGRVAISRHKGKGWSAEELMDMLKALVGVLAQAQRYGLSHRDIKTANILFDRYGVVKLADFGSSKWAKGQSHDPQTIQGTLGFTSSLLRQWYLKFLMGAVKDSKLLHNVYKSDVYSLGVSFICFAMLLHNPPNPPFTNILPLPAHPYLSSLLTRMIIEDESQRPDFIELEGLLEGMPEPPQIEEEKPLNLDFMRTIKQAPSCVQCRGALSSSNWQTNLSAEIAQKYRQHLNCLCSLLCMQSYTKDYRRMSQPCLQDPDHFFSGDRAWQRDSDVVGSVYVYLILSICSRACWDQLIEGLRSGTHTICRFCQKAVIVSAATPALNCGCYFCSLECLGSFLDRATEHYRVKKQLTCPYHQEPIPAERVSGLLRDNWPEWNFGEYSWYCLKDLSQSGLFRLPCGKHYCCANCLTEVEKNGRRCWLCPHQE
jgi:hypothetical protein